MLNPLPNIHNHKMKKQDDKLEDLNSLQEIKQLV